MVGFDILTAVTEYCGRLDSNATYFDECPVFQGTITSIFSVEE
jgi:hypothetical protein